MKVAHFTAIQKLEIVERSMPKLDAPDDVFVRIDRLGVCGSDVHYYLDGRIGDQVLDYPATLGHECAGTIVEVGQRVSNVRLGDRVAVDPAISCGQCDQCRAGRANTCRHLQFMGAPGQAPGAAAEYVVVPGRNCVRIPDAMSLDEAALAEPLSIGLHAVRLVGLKPEATVGIFGAGPIGLSVLLCARAIVSSTAYVTDLLDERLKAACECGASWAGSPKRQDVVAEILHEQPHGLNVVFECSGDPKCIDQAQELLTPGGTLVFVGIPAVEHVQFDIHRMRRKELTFKNVRRQNNCVGPVIEMIAAGRINARRLLTHRFPLAKIGEAFDLVAGYRDGVIKAMIDVTAPGS